MGLLDVQAAISREDPVMLGTLYMFTQLGLVLSLSGDLTCQAMAICIVFGSLGDRAGNGGVDKRVLQRKVRYPSVTNIGLAGTPDNTRNCLYTRRGAYSNC